MKAPKELKVTSHVGRDLLASAAVFKTEAAVVWEYVVNSLQYVERGVTPKVTVFVRQRERVIEVCDNGMGISDLNHFFTMHGENLERRAGRPGRGKFGTGKSAAFGIANVLRVETHRNGYRNIVELKRSAIDSSGGKEIPVEWLVKNEPTTRPSGTIVTIGEVLLEKINTPSIIEYIERHLSAFRHSSPEVAVNDHVCVYKEPIIDRTRLFKPTSTQSAVLGEVTLSVKVSRAPLSLSEQGIFVFAGQGNLIAIERGGLENKEFANYLFGEVDVPALDDPESPIEAYDPTRSLQLNPNHPRVAVLISLIGSKLEEVRQELVKEYREARKTETARRLSAEAQKIADILNEDFRGVKDRLHEIRSASARPGSVSANFGDSLSGGSEADSWVVGSQEPGRTSKATSSGNGRGGKGRKDPNITRHGDKSLDGTESVDPVGGLGAKKSKPRGGFGVDYRTLGKDGERSLYDPTSLMILINLDHPVLAAALKDSNVEDVTFRRLSYEIAFSEYSMALGYEMLRQDINIPADDILYEVRTTLNRVARAAASLYS